MPQFQILSHHGGARRGRIQTPHGPVETPAFLFCATKATLKGVPVQAIMAHDTQILLANTYHLMLQPGSALIAKMGGIHRFMGWDGPVFTDSGGYQIFSLGHGSVSEEIKGNRGGLTEAPKSLTKITEEGAFFRSYRDGSRHLLTPESAITTQRELGADLICVLDECTPFHVSRRYTERSLGLSHRWAQRSLTQFQTEDTGTQGLYGIIQGGVYPDLRHESATYINGLPFFGHAIGGSLGATKSQMQEVIDMALASLSRDRPIHLLGIGGIQDLFFGVSRGIDTFDCVSPTRLGRHGGALISLEYWKDAWEDFHGREQIHLSKACFREDPRPLLASCTCWTCQRYSRAYLHHLVKSKEILAMVALTLHNVAVLNGLMAEIRQGIEENRLDAVRSRWIQS